MALEALGRARDGLGTAEEADAIGDPVADEEIAERRNGEIDHDLAERVDLVLVPDGASLEEGKAGVHGKDEDRPHQQEKYVRARLQLLHRPLVSFPG